MNQLIERIKRKELLLGFPLVALYQFGKYGVVGISNTIVTLSTIFILMKVFMVSYVISNAIGYILGFMNSYILNKIWTFKSRGPVVKEAVLFIVIFLICYCIQLLFLIVFKEVMNIKVEISQLLSMIIYTIFNFLGNKYVTFRKEA